MILNEYSNNIEYPYYEELDYSCIMEASKLIKIYSQNSYVELQEFIDDIIVRLDRRSVLLRMTSRNRYSAFRNYINTVKKNAKTRKMLDTCTIKIPNKLYYTIPDISQVYSMEFHKIGWDTKIANKHDKLTTYNSAYYNKLVKNITSGNVKTVAQLPSLQLYTLEQCDDNRELIKALDKLVFPMEDVNFILKFTEECKGLLKTLKNMSVSSMSNVSNESERLSKAFKEIDTLNGLFRNTINILTRIYEMKLDVIFGGVVERGTSNIMVEESCTNISGLLEACTHLEEGFNIDSIKECKRNIFEYNQSNIEYLHDYVECLYETTKYRLKNEYLNTTIKYHMFSENDLNNILNVSTYDIDNINKSFKKYMDEYPDMEMVDTHLVQQNFDKINKALDDEYKDIISELDKIKEEISSTVIDDEHLGYSTLFDRDYNSLGIILKSEVDDLRLELLSNSKLKDLINTNTGIYSIIVSGVIDDNIYNYVYNTISRIEPSMLNTFKKYYSVLKMNDMTNNKVVSSYYSKPLDGNIPQSMIPKIIQFQNKCAYII